MSLYNLWMSLLIWICEVKIEVLGMTYSHTLLYLQVSPLKTGICYFFPFSFSNVAVKAIKSPFMLRKFPNWVKWHRSIKAAAMKRTSASAWKRGYHYFLPNFLLEDAVGMSGNVTFGFPMWRSKCTQKTQCSGQLTPYQSLRFHHW